MPSTIYLDDEFVKWIDDKLAGLKMNRQDLVELSGVDSGRLSRIMNGKTPLTFETAMQIAPHLGYDDPYLFLVKAQFLGPTASFTPQELELVHTSRALNEEGREVLILMGQALQKRFPNERPRRGGAGG